MQRLKTGAALLAALAVPTAIAAPPASGIETQYFDTSVRAQDDLYQHVNGKWLATTEIPPDKPGYGPAYQLFDQIQERLRAIVEKSEQASPGSEARKIGDLYASFMNTSRINDLGLTPLRTELARIDAVQSRGKLTQLIAHLQQLGVATPFDPEIDQDHREATAYALYLGQSGLGLPDRDYYLEDDARFKDVRAKYAQHIERMLGLAGDRSASTNATAIVQLETDLARVQWTKVKNRDPVATYNKFSVPKLRALAPELDWESYLRATGMPAVRNVVVQQPSYMQAASTLLRNAPLSTWRAYFRWQLLRAYAPYLSDAFVDERFGFFGTVLSGVPENRPRWKRGITLVDHAIGEGLGRLYVEQYFPPESKARMDALVQNLLATYKTSIAALDWMSGPTKEQAQAKLAKLTTKIGYPTLWRDYTKLTIVSDDLVGNLMRANEFEFNRNAVKLGKPIDRNEWFMTPQTVNAYYNPEMNEIVFPAGILQPPYFNPEADDATNYGAIGATIGHEMSHGFDDSGSQFDGDGNLRDWWTKEDHEKYAARTRALIEQYNAYEPVAGYHVNGELTLGENIADNAGLAIAYRAYQLSLGGKTAPALDGFTGDRRFFLSYAQSWRDKTRVEQQIVYLKSDPHSPDKFRVIGTVVNQPPFYTTFDVKPGDRMYLPPEKRVILW
jgi:predicted metalloendopeptidase